MNLFVAEFQRYKGLLEKTIEQITDEDFFRAIGGQGNSIAIIVKHLSGNLISRFTDFLTSDGEKEWRDRESEFRIEQRDRSGLLEMWAKAWDVLEESVFSLGPDDMHKMVKIRGVQFSVEEALARSVAHFSYHVGQIIFAAKFFTGKNWKYLSIPPGGSAQYNTNPTKEKAINLKGSDFHSL